MNEKLSYETLGNLQLNLIYKITNILLVMLMMLVNRILHANIERSILTVELFKR